MVLRLKFEPWGDHPEKPQIVIGHAGVTHSVEISNVKPRRKMHGFLFARPDSTVAQSEILPRLDYFHLRSGENVTFYCAGYEAATANNTNRIITSVANKNWTFSNEAFCRIVASIEAETKWHYSGGTEILLVNSYLDIDPDGNEESETVDMSTAVVCQLDNMLKDGAIESVEIFLERIFRYAESCDNEDPTWGFSAELLKKQASLGILRLILSVLPFKIGQNFNRIKHFVTWDLAKSA